MKFADLKGGDEFRLDSQSVGAILLNDDTFYIKLSERTISRCHFVNCVRKSDGKLMFIKDDVEVE